MEALAAARRRVLGNRLRRRAYRDPAFITRGWSVGLGAEGSWRSALAP